jgi:hypothetical protein
MNEVSAFPDRRDVLFDVRDDGRFLRYRWHPELAVGVVSLWRGDRCSGTFKIAREDVPKLIQALVGSLAAETPIPAMSAPLDVRTAWSDVSSDSGKIVRLRQRRYRSVVSGAGSTIRAGCPRSGQVARPRERGRYESAR